MTMFFVFVVVGRIRYCYCTAVVIEVAATSGESDHDLKDLVLVFDTDDYV